jgi:hypothetical protein
VPRFLLGRAGALVPGLAYSVSGIQGFPEEGQVSHLAFPVCT